MALPAAQFTSQMSFLDTPAQYERVKKWSEDHPVSKAEVVREAVSYGLDIIEGKARIVYPED